MVETTSQQRDLKTVDKISQKTEKKTKMEDRIEKN